jgi:hypothetical protein
LVAYGIKPSQPSNAIGYAEFLSRSHDAVICVQAYEGETIPVNNHDAGVQIW